MTARILTTTVMTPEIIATLAQFYDLPPESLERELRDEPMTDDEINKLSEGLYSHIKRFPDGRIACVARFIYTTAILDGVNRFGYDNRWCYHSAAEARKALAEWDGTGEPTGWHRHPSSGRRRDDDGNEYVNP